MFFKNNTNNFVFMLLSHDMCQRCWKPLITMSNMHCTHHQKTWNLYHHIPVSSFSSLCIANRRRPKTNPDLIPPIAVNVSERQVPQLTRMSWVLCIIKSPKFCHGRDIICFRTELLCLNETQSPAFFLAFKMQSESLRFEKHPKMVLINATETD